MHIVHCHQSIDVFLPTDCFVDSWPACREYRVRQTLLVLILTHFLLYLLEISQPQMVTAWSLTYV